MSPFPHINCEARILLLTDSIANNIMLHIISMKNMLHR